MHHDTKKILIRNTSDRLLRILRCQKLGHVVDIWCNKCFLADVESAVYSATVLPQTAPFFKENLSWALTLTEPSIETTLDNKVKVYGDEYTVTLLSQLVAKYPSIWESERFVLIPIQRWMKVQLKPG